MTLPTASAASGDVQPKAKIFISYSRRDLAFADRLDEALKARGFEPLIDRDEIYAFEDWWQRIQALITQADTIIFVLSPDAVASDVCKREVQFAALLHKRFAPVVCKRVDDTAVPAPLRRFNYIFCDDDAQFEARMDLLAEALSTDIDWIRKHTEFGAMARKWETAGRPGPRGLLLRSPVLEEAEGWIASRPHHAPLPTETILAFVTESRKTVTAERRRAKRIRATVGIVFVWIIAVVAGLTYGGILSRAYLELRVPIVLEMLWPKLLTTSAERVLRPKDTFKECSICPEMVVLPAGEFMMGSPNTEKDREYEEGPQHEVTIVKPFAVSKFEVTFDELDACYELGGCKARLIDQGWGRGSRPAINISWDGAKEYVAWLSRRTGKPYRLLSESEWEYAARAGSDTAYSWGDDIGNGNANCDGCRSQWDGISTAPVGSFPANAFGLHDMHGNVWEWVEDCYKGSYRACRLMVRLGPTVIANTVALAAAVGTTSLTIFAQLHVVGGRPTFGPA